MLELSDLFFSPLIAVTLKNMIAEKLSYPASLFLVQ